MIALNITIVFQCINFAITYFLLDILIVRPVIRNLLQNKKNATVMREEITTKEKDISEFIAERKDQLSLFQERISRNYEFKEVQPNPFAACKIEKAKVGEAFQSSDQVKQDILRHILYDDTE